jgi:hypothetical protein
MELHCCNPESIRESGILFGSRREDSGQAGMTNQLRKNIAIYEQDGNSERAQLNWQSLKVIRLIPKVLE